MKFFDFLQWKMPMGLQSSDGKSLNQTQKRQLDSVVPNHHLLLNFSIQYVHHFPGLLVAEERLDAVSTFVTRLQESAEQIKDGFQIEHRGGHYDFTATFTDR